jgi:hypothetical protein
MATLPNASEVALLVNWPTALVSLEFFGPDPNRAHPETRLVSARVAAKAIQPLPVLHVFGTPRMSVIPSGNPPGALPANASLCLLPRG